MPIYDSTLDYIFETDIMVEHGWAHPLHVRKRAQKEYLELRKKIKTLEQTTDMQHETTISDLKLIGKLQHENKEWIEDVKGLSELFHENPIIHEIISTGEKYYLYEIDKETVDAVHDKHKALVQKYNKTT